MGRGLEAAAQRGPRRVAKGLAMEPMRWAAGSALHCAGWEFVSGELGS